MFILPLALTIYAFIDCLNTSEEETKHLPKVAWVFIILLFWIVGPIVWLVGGKARTGPRPGAGRPGGRGRSGGGWVAPDDNPEFLKSLGGDRPAAPREDREEGSEPEKDARPADEQGGGGPADGGPGPSKS
ncbi:PLD nuclease N-terminal domain-containing protein [Streptomyces sp. NPDC046887]|uniref:PLD nuclease N-terminal domain-containing protein n=1 Tax=Streptomyces sp. NPDC046887 TaxID=3155472 RepID=UPI0033FED9E8